MSEPKLVSPLLDGFIMGEAISEHHGVRCCPALRENTDERYIVKIISIPATQVQLDALLLTGAYADPSQALDYFKELADSVVGEANILDRLSRMEGYVPYLGHQIHQMEDGVGYDVYLLNPYRRSLEKLLRTEPMTHLSAVNLGLDMCAALAACRRAGFLYADLKPSNIFRSDTYGYFIGDLGFISLSSLKYASLPEKYRSSHTAPEITDAMSTLNDTIDIYALGLTLYQAYNNGEFPFEGNAPAQVLPPPMYADYEMAEIILKACAPDPRDRWQDPAQMGQALVNYMQRNSVNDTPIVPPPVVIEDEPEEPEEFLTEEENDAELAELLAMIPDEEPPAPETEDPIATEEETADEAPAEEPTGQMDEETIHELSEEVPQEIPEDVSEEAPAEIPEDVSEETTEDAADSEDELIQLSFMDALESDETTPSEENTASLQDTEVTDEVAQMLAQADDLISHELPEPVVAPAAIDVPIPPPIVLEPEIEETVEEISEEDTSAVESPAIDMMEEAALFFETDEEDSPAPEETAEEEVLDEDQPSSNHRKKRHVRRWIYAAVLLLLLAAGAISGYFWYQECYLQTISELEVYATVDEIHVDIVSDIDESLLTVYCTDIYGNARNSALKEGKATFTTLTPGTQYRIHVEIDGVHKLLGATSKTCATTDVTQILNFSANKGTEDGSVVLSFSVNGPEPETWIMEYSTASDATPQRKEFSGHSVTITGLTAGSEYRFSLITAEEIILSGSRELSFTPLNNISAENLTVTACGNGSLRVQWTLPEGTDAQKWIVRCYNNVGYDQTLNCSETTAEFTGLDHTTGYTITVTAEGSSKSISTEVTADPINITGFTTEVTNPWAMTLKWDFTGTAPVSGWVLTYTVDGGEPITVNCQENNAIIPLFPNGTYSFAVRPVDEITFFAIPFSYGPVQVQTFSGYGVTAEQMTFHMYLTGDKNAAKKVEFAIGEKASLYGKVSSTYARSNDKIISTFVIRSAENELISADTSSSTWEKLWKKRTCTLDIPNLPTEAGEYFLDLYFNGMYVTTLSFTIA